MIAVTLDEADLIVLYRHLDAAPAGAHIAGGILHLRRTVLVLVLWC